MKKRKPCILLAVALVLGLMAGGCASVKATLTDMVEKVCGFDAAASEEAQMAKKFISGAMPLVGVVAGVTISAEQAEAIFDMVVDAAQTGGCVALKDLQAAMDFFDKLAAQYQMKQPSAKGRMAAMKSTPALSKLRVMMRQ